MSASRSVSRSVGRSVSRPANQQSDNQRGSYFGILPINHSAGHGRTMRNRNGISQDARDQVARQHLQQKSLSSNTKSGGGCCEPFVASLTSAGLHCRERSLCRHWYTASLTMKIQETRRSGGFSEAQTDGIVSKRGSSWGVGWAAQDQDQGALRPRLMPGLRVAAPLPG